MVRLDSLTSLTRSAQALEPLLLVAALLFGAGTFVACGGADDGDPGPASEETAEADVSGAPADIESAPAGASGSDALVDLGEPRDDLTRFQGVYGTEERPNQSFFVSYSCDGYLQIGAMWGDVAPWVMRSDSDTEFMEARPNPNTQPLGVSFTVDGDGNAETMTFTSGLEDYGVQAREGELPDGWEPDCPE